MIVPVVAHPAASRPRVAWDGEALHVWITPPAAQGRANRALIEAIANACGTQRSRVELVRGTRGRRKLVRIDGLEPVDLAKLRG